MFPRDPRRNGDVYEAAIAVIPIQSITPKVGDIDLQVAVVVHVAHRDTLPVACIRQIGGAAHALEGPVRLLGVEPVRCRGTRLVWRWITHLEQVQVAVAVAVEQGHAPPVISGSA